MNQIIQMLDRVRPATPLVLRIALGVVFVYHGYDKFDGGIDMVEEMFTMWGVPAPGLTAPLTAVVEIAAGLALLAGVVTRFAAGALGLVMVGALVYVKLDMGLISNEPMPGAELDLALLAGLFTLVAMGAGRWSVDAMAGFDRSTTEMTEPSLPSGTARA